MDHARSITTRSTVAVVIWALGIVLGIVYLVAGVGKLVGYPPMIALFQSIKGGQLLRYIVGLTETASALVFLFMPSLAGIAALILCPLMLGAIATTYTAPHHELARIAAVLCLVGLIALAWLRRADTVSVVRLAAGRLGIGGVSRE